MKLTSLLLLAACATEPKEPACVFMHGLGWVCDEWPHKCSYDGGMRIQLGGECVLISAGFVPERTK